MKCGCRRCRILSSWLLTVLFSLLTPLKLNITTILVSKALLVNTLYKLIQWMIGVYLVSSMTQQLEPADRDLDQWVHEMVLVDHVDNSPISFRDHFIGKSCVYCYYIFSIINNTFNGNFLFLILAVTLRGTDWSIKIYFSPTVWLLVFSGHPWATMMWAYSTCLTWPVI